MVKEKVPHILLVKPFADRDSWGIPKGHINVGETEEQCALRETLEEAGIQVTLLQRLTPVKCSYRNEKKTVISFLAKLEFGLPRAADGENVDIQWFPLTELPNIHIYQRPLMEEVKKVWNEWAPATSHADSPE